jgi:hypothetical protein
VTKLIAVIIFLGGIAAVVSTPSLSEGFSKGLDLALRRERVVSYKGKPKSSSRALYSLTGGTDLKEIDEKIGSGRFTKAEFKLATPGRTYFFSSLSSPTKRRAKHAARRKTKPKSKLAQAPQRRVFKRRG